MLLFYTVNIYLSLNEIKTKMLQIMKNNKFLHASGNDIENLFISLGYIKKVYSIESHIGDISVNRSQKEIAC